MMSREKTSGCFRMKSDFQRIDIVESNKALYAILASSNIVNIGLYEVLLENERPGFRLSKYSHIQKLNFV